MNFSSTWKSDYYRSIAEVYLQTTFEVLLKQQMPFYLKTIINCLNFESLALKVRMTKNTKLMPRVKELEQYEKKEIKGLQAHLSILAHCELGQYFEIYLNSFDLSTIIQEFAVVYFALTALYFTSFSSVFGGTGH